MHLGIDFGTCFSSAAVLNGRQFDYVRDGSGGNAQPLFPSAIYFTPEGELLIGTLARNSARKHPDPCRPGVQAQPRLQHPLPARRPAVSAPGPDCPPACPIEGRGGEELQHRDLGSHLDRPRQLTTPTDAN